MPFFSAIPTNLSLNPEGVPAPLVSAGPYYVQEWVQRRSAIVEATLLRLERNEVDLGNIPPTAASELAEKYGINRGRFLIRKQPSPGSSR